MIEQLKRYVLCDLLDRHDKTHMVVDGHRTPICRRCGSLRGHTELPQSISDETNGCQTGHTPETLPQDDVEVTYVNHRDGRGDYLVWIPDPDDMEDSE